MLQTTFYPSKFYFFLSKNQFLDLFLRFLSVISQSMIFDIWPFQLCLVIGFGLMTVVGIFQLYQDIQQLRGKPVFKWAPEEEEIDI